MIHVDKKQHHIVKKDAVETFAENL